MARKYGKKAQASVKSAMRRRKKGTLKSGRSGKKVTSRKQAIAIGLSEARKKGAKVPPAPKKRTTKKSASSKRKTVRRKRK
ncbi:MAG TPA: DUF6496 domain-containing protein [Candidatus Babeliales bacterium]|nr:DUF6496 domain-containing protein [Candidatus Babeliales bacterium]